MLPALFEDKTLLIIFLDIDGVLNKGLVASASPVEDVLKIREHGWMNKSLIQNFNDFLAQVNAKIVLSSSWRSDKLQVNKKMLKAFGITAEVIGQTPDFDASHKRGDEVTDWLNKNAPAGFTQFMMIDDCNDFHKHQEPQFLKTDTYKGFNIEAKNKAIKLAQALISK